MTRGTSVPFITGVLANGAIPTESDHSRLAYLRPFALETQYGEPDPKIHGCRSAACRTLKSCLCHCKSCRRWCIYRGIKIEKDEDKVSLRYASGKLIVTMSPAEYEGVKHLWERFVTT